jgi:hypothetical protein
LAWAARAMAIAFVEAGARAALLDSDEAALSQTVADPSPG